jgi:hypothetical protein
MALHLVLVPLGVVLLGLRARLADGGLMRVVRRGAKGMSGVAA